MKGKKKKRGKDVKVLLMGKKNGLKGEETDF